MRHSAIPPAKFGVVIPVYNEPRLQLLLSRFDFASVPNVVVVDDGSNDGCSMAAKHFPVVLLQHEKPRGVGAAIRTGLRFLKRQGIEVAVVMAGNNKDDPSDIPQLLSAIERGADYVQGSRFLNPAHSSETPFVRRLITRAVAMLWSLRFGRKLTEVTNGYRAYRLSILEDPRLDLSQSWLDRYELEYYIHYKILSLGYCYAEVSVAKRYPTDGLPTSKIRLLSDLWSLLRPLVLLSLRIRR